MRLLVAALFITLVCISSAVPAKEQADDYKEIKQFQTRPITQEILAQLRKGGYVLYMRHGNTDTSRPDAVKVDFNDCATQRMLSKEGRRVAAEIGNYIRKANIPVGDIYASPMCRTKETALLAFGKQPNVNMLLRYTANMPDKVKFDALETIRELVSKPVQGQTNRVIVAHSQNLMALFGYLPSPEGTVVIFKPLGNQQFNYIASIQPAQWATILH